MEKSEESVTLKPLMDAIEEQSKRSLRPIYYKNEYIGELSISEFDIQACKEVVAYLDGCRKIGHYYYRVYDKVIARIDVARGKRWEDRERYHYPTRSIIPACYEHTDTLRMLFWITNKDGANNGTKPKELLELEEELLKTYNG